MDESSRQRVADRGRSRNVARTGQRSNCGSENRSNVLLVGETSSPSQGF
jgi:hypothetical protein